MPLFRRFDGTPVPNLPATRRIMPFLMPTKTESLVYFRQVLDVTSTLAFLERRNAERAGRPKATLFHVYLFAAARAINERPGLNRFISGRRIWQRNAVWISFSAKKELVDGSPLVVLKRRFDPGMTFDAFVEEVSASLRDGRSDKRSHVDKELGLFLALPGPLLALGVRIVAKLDAWNLLPRSFLEPDPMYASLFVANLGSVRLDAAYHHLYEYGTISIFAVMGRKHTLADGRTECEIKYTFDERIEDGLYCATSLERLKTLVESPEVLLTEPLPSYLPGTREMPTVVKD